MRASQVAAVEDTARNAVTTYIQSWQLGCPWHIPGRWWTGRRWRTAHSGRHWVRALPSRDRQTDNCIFLGIHMVYLSGGGGLGGGGGLQAATNTWSELCVVGTPQRTRELRSMWTDLWGGGGLGGGGGLQAEQGRAQTTFETTRCPETFQQRFAPGKWWWIYRWRAWWRLAASSRHQAFAADQYSRRQ